MIRALAWHHSQYIYPNRNEKRVTLPLPYLYCNSKGGRTMRLSRKAEWTAVIAMALVWGFVGLNRIGIAFLFPILQPLFHLNFTEVGLLISGTSITWALSTLIGGYLSDRIGFKPLYLFSMAIAAIFSSFLGIAWNFLSLFVIRDLIGLGDGVGWSVGQDIVGKISSPTRRAFNQGLVAAGYTLVGVGVGAFIITQLAINFGWRSVYWILALPAIALVLLLMKLLPATRLTDQTSQVGTTSATPLSLKDFLSLFRTWQMAVLIILNIVVLVWIQGFLGFAPLFLQHLKYPLATSGLIITLVGVFGTIGQLALPYFSDLIGRKPISIGALVISALCLIVASVISVPTFVLATLMAISGFCSFGSLPIISATVVAESVPGSQTASALGVTNFFAVLVGATLVPILLGFIADKVGIATAILTIGIIQAIGMVLALALRETAPRVTGLAWKTLDKREGMMETAL